MARTYADAITALNTLQSNFAVVDAIRRSGKKMNEQALPEMIEWLRKIGYQPSDLNTLNAIHIAGTKGKGSTAAFISSILNQFRAAEIRNAPKKIGLYTSPHLRFVRERIQINGQPLTENEFARYFFETWDRLEATAARVGEDPHATTAKPVYFRFLTLMAFHTYLSEAVDCAVIECGIGGAYDSTNIIPSPAVTGITSLGIDHVGVLGSTIEEIAWHKAGVMKPPSSPNHQRPKCFTPSSQPTAAKIVLSQIAAQQSNDLVFTDISPAIASGSFPLGLSAPFQQTNASLALEITSSFLSSRGIDTSTPHSQSHIREGLHSVSWPGRCDTRIDKVDSRITWYIDGGHTLESIELAGKWFGEELKVKRKQLDIENEQERTSDDNDQASSSSTGKSSRKRKLKTYLIFNQQTRDALSLATALYNTLSSTLPCVPGTPSQTPSETNSKPQQSALANCTSHPHPHPESNIASNSNSTSTSSSVSKPNNTQSNANDHLQAQLQSASPFSTVIFTTNTPYSQSSSSSSKQFPTPKSADLLSSNLDSHAIANLTVQTLLAETWTHLDQLSDREGRADVHVVRSIEEGINIVRGQDGNGDGDGVAGDDTGDKEEEVDVHKVALVTGSLHLVGAVLEVLEGSQIQ